MSLIEDIRFGYGSAGGRPSPGEGVDPDRVLAQFDRPDPALDAFRRPDSASRRALLEDARERKRAQQAGAAAGPAAAARALKEMFQQDSLAYVLLPVAATNGFVERLVNLWSNRLTVAVASNAGTFIQPFRDEVVRAHLTGRFADMLRASLWHPAMLIYLNQNASVGPGSPLALRKGRGLNENLAREFLELHTMGAGYDQADVTELARLLAGMRNDGRDRGMNPTAVTPGPKMILGERFSDDDPEAEIDRMVEMVAARPETARSVGHMLARHFIADDPPRDLVDQLTRVYLASDGALLPLYRTLLSHPAASYPQLAKLRSPQEYAAAGLRALGLTGQETRLPGLHKRRGFRLPEALARMGQPIFRARRPDGWPETAQGWLTAPMMAARIDFAADLARAAGDRSDPVGLCDGVLGGLASPALRPSIQGAEQRWEGVAVLLGSPDFMRR